MHVATLVCLLFSDVIYDWSESMYIENIAQTILIECFPRQHSKNYNEASPLHLQPLHAHK